MKDDVFLRYVLSQPVMIFEKQFDEIADTFRDPRVLWIKNGEWYKKDIDGKETSYGKVLLAESEWYKYHIST